MVKVFVFSFLPVLLYLFFKTRKSFHMLQQNWYDDGNRYLKWILKSPYKVFIEIDFFFIIFVFLTVFPYPYVVMTLFAFFYLVVTYLYQKRVKKEQSKKPLVFTKRVRRLTVTTILLYLLPIVTCILTFEEGYLGFYYFIIGLLVYLNYFVVMLSNVINHPVERFVFYYYKRKAVGKLKRMSNQMKVIGITGSYGKTSSKNILSDILNVKYNAFPTPKNFNTTYGLINTINNFLDKFSELFIAEMGAFKKGEIKELCDLVHPTYGILTKIGTAHLESFGSQQNIQEGKFELIESLPHDGIGILNGDDPLQRSYSLKNKCRLLWIGMDSDEVDVKADHIKLNHQGMTFDCYFKGDPTPYSFETKLLGKTNVYNILAGIALGKELGLTVEQLQAGVKRVRPVEHRLELKKVGGLNIIDDAYNSNPVGASMALEVLDCMPGEKLIVTPGMIELGDKQYELNLELGRQIAKVADQVILVGVEQTKPIKEGLLLEKYPEAKIHILNDVKEAFPMMRKISMEKETYTLLENDLPDIFNEG